MSAPAQQPDTPARVVGPNDLLAHALRLHHAGKIDVAAELYERVLALEPDQPYALHLLGEIMLRRKQHDKALNLISRAVTHLTTHPEAHNNLAAVLQALGRLKEAEQMYRRAIALNPDLTIAHSNLGAVLLALNRKEEAEAALKTALTQAPNLAEAHLNLGLTLAAQGKNEEAVAAYQQAVALDPMRAEAHINLGKLHTALGRHGEAEACYRRAVAIAPDNADVHNNLGVSLFSQRRFPEAAAMLRRATELKPDFIEALNNLGATLRNSEQLHEAVLCFDRVIVLKPDHASAHNNRGLTLVEMGRAREGLDAIDKAMGLKANFWRAHGNYLLSLNYLDDATPADLRAAHEAFDAAFRKGRGPDEEVAARDLTPGRRLRIGYVSPDFKRHSCAFFMEKLLANHDRSAVEVFCYADVAYPDAVTARLQGYADHWRDTTKLDRTAFRAAVAADAIDILVDLAGHTAESRLHVLVDRLAPVQVNWLGYPGTTGIAAIDYRITDARVDPPGASDAHCTETLLRLPDTFLCYQPPEEAPAVAPAPNAGGAPFTFASFNNLPKVTRNVVATWARILCEAPGTRLLLKSRSLIDAVTCARIGAEFAEEGIDPTRLELVGWLRKPGDHLRLYERADLALDPFPYNGTTTTCEALWMGVPVLTLAGERHAARVGASLLGGLGLDAYIATSPDDYVARAVALAAEPGPLNALRHDLRARMAAAPLSDGPRFARAMEAAYRRMWQRWCAGPASRLQD